MRKRLMILWTAGNGYLIRHIVLNNSIQIIVNIYIMHIEKDENFCL